MVGVHINNARSVGATLVKGENDGDDSLKFYRADLNAIVIDPFTSVDIFERVSGYSGDRYSKSATETSGYVKNNLDGEYKLVDGQYVSLSEEELDRRYRYFSSTVEMTYANGSKQVLPITWDFNSVNVTYAGGEFTAYAIVNYDARFDYARSKDQDATVNEMGVQRIKVQVRVLDRSVVSVVDSSDLTSLQGYVGQDTYINPYEYRRPTMPNGLWVNVRDADIDENGEQTSSTTMELYAVKEVGSALGRLVWNYSEFRPTYEGGAVFVTAELVGRDGNKQSVKIPFLVYKMNASKIENSGFTSNVSNGKTVSNYPIDVYSGSKLSVPTSYKVYFTGQKPVYDKTTGNVSFVNMTTAENNSLTRTFSTIIATMPANITYDVKKSGITSSVNGQSATLQLGNQERISVGLTVKATANITGTPSITVDTAGSVGDPVVLNMTYTYGSYILPVVYYGTAREYDAKGNLCATYKVVFSSPKATFELPMVGARKVVYSLTPVIGVVIDANGSVVTKDANGNPLGQYTCSAVTITING